MQRMWRQMFAALAGVLVVAGLSSAQSSLPIPQPLPPSPVGTQYVPIQAPPIAAPIAPSIAPIGGQIFVKGSGGCSGCGSSAHSAPCAPNNSCNNGCGSCKSDCKFMFGSCKSFFSPCGADSNGGGKHGHFGGRCGAWPLGKPYATGYNGCVYDSWLNH